MPHWTLSIWFAVVLAFSGCVFQCTGEEIGRPMVRIPAVDNRELDRDPIHHVETRRTVSPDEECLERGRFQSIGAIHALFPSLDLEHGTFIGSAASIEAVDGWSREMALRVGAIVGHLEVFGPSANVDALLDDMGKTPSLEIYGLPIPTWRKTKSPKGQVGHWVSAPIVFSTTRTESRWALLPKEGDIERLASRPKGAEPIRDADRWTLKEFESFPLFERVPLLQGTAIVLRAAATNDPRDTYHGIVNFVVTAVELWRDNESVGCAPSDR